MALLDYWPSAKRIEAVMPLDAEALDEATLLAIHRPVRFKASSPDGTVVCSYSEHDLLRALLAEDPPDSPIAVPILGGPGTGKTHLLRWIEIRLRSRSDRQLHVVRTSGRVGAEELIGRVLEGLAGPGYDAIRREMTPPGGLANVNEAREALLAWLRAALLREKDRAQQRVADARQRGEAPARGDVHLAQWLAEGLHHLLADPETGRQFTSQGKGSPRVLDRLADRLVLPGLLSVEFCEQDFLKRDDVDVLRAGDKARSCTKQLMLTAAVGKQYRELAVSLMNRLSAEAAHALGVPAPTPRGVRFHQLRCMLRTEGLELVLLLDGVQPDAGWMSHFQESSAEPGPAPCLVRIAFTSVDAASTALPPAWEFDNRADADPAEVVAAVVELVGDYLHACRGDIDEMQFGVVRLAVEAFGRSASGRPLFPFNRVAVEQLARMYLTTVAGRLALNLRAIVDHILRDTLLGFRPDFEQGSFPPPGFHGLSSTQLVPSVRIALEHLYAGDLLERHAVMLACWAGNPATLADSPLSPHVYAAFGMQPPVLIVPMLEAPAVPADVRAFLDAVAADGASLALLTPAVVQWLQEHREYETLRIVRSD